MEFDNNYKKLIETQSVNCIYDPLKEENEVRRHALKLLKNKSIILLLHVDRKT